MKDFLRQLLDEMKDKVISNLKEVKGNEADIRKYLTNPETYSRAYNLQLKYKYNRKLLNENIDYLEVQHKIVNLITKYGQKDFMKTPIEKLLAQCVDIDYFNETIEGRLTFNENHPYYRDEQFIDQLLQHYLNVENYEECLRIKAIREHVKSMEFGKKAKTS
jgi:hypothetical protein